MRTRLLLTFILFLATAFGYGQQSISCTLTVLKNLSVQSFSCTPSPNNQFNASFSATVQPLTVAVSPNPATVVVAQTQQFSATVQNAAQTSAVTWTVTGGIGTVDNTGLFTAAAVGTGTVVATSVQDTTISNAANVTVNFAPPPPSPTVVSIAVNPANPTISTSSSITMTATAKWSDNSTTDVTSTAAWNSSNTNVATIGSPANPQPVNSTVTAGTSTISATFQGVSGNTTLTTVAPPPPPHNLVSIVVTPNPASVTVGGTSTFTATGTFSDGTTDNITPTSTFSSNTGSVTVVGNVGTCNAPVNATITATKGLISGTTTLVCNAASSGGSNPYCGSGNVPNFGASDGPATLPTQCTNTAETSTPAPGASTNVPSNGDLQAAINSASCGDTLNLAVGANYTGSYTLPNKGCDNAHWIRIQSASSSASLPAEGIRLTPCYAGVASLPGLPPFSNCPSTTVVTAKITATGTTAFTPAPGASFYRIGPGIEIAQNGAQTSLVNLSSTILPTNIILDRVWIHGTAGSTTGIIGVKMNGTNMALIDSTITDIHSVHSDNRGVVVNTGTGPYKITGNFIEAGGSSILFGNDGASFGNPTNAEIRNNHLFVPLAEMANSSFWNGVFWTVGPRLEIRNLSNALIEGNIMEYAWGDLNKASAQGGDGSIAWIGSKNAGTNGLTMLVSNVTIRYNKVSHAGGGFYYLDALASNGAAAAQTFNISDHDNVFDDISLGWARIGTSQGTVHRLFGSVIFSPPLNITIQHDTAISLSGTGFLSLGNNNPTNPYYGFVFKNNIEYQNYYGIYGCGGKAGVGALFNCTISSVVTNNLVVGTSRLSMPSGNFNVSTTDGVGFTSFNSGNGGNYLLKPSSPFITSGTDGLPLGADINAVTQATANVN